MAQLKPNRFSSWELTPLEFKAGCTFNELQLKVIQNCISDAASSKVALTYDPQNPLKFAQQEAELTGQIEILEFLLSQSVALNEVSQPLEGE